MERDGSTSRSSVRARAGLHARREVERAGGRALLIEHGPYGTTCARVGCMPSKLLIAAAEAAHAVAGAQRFGVHPGGPLRIDGPAVLERVRHERDRFVAFAVHDTEAIPEEHRLCGHARFAGPTTLVVDDRVRVEARAVVVATGSAAARARPVRRPRRPRARQATTSSSSPTCPQSRRRRRRRRRPRAGTSDGAARRARGVLLNRSDRVGPLTDPELQRIARRDCRRELDLRPGVDVRAAREEPDGIRLSTGPPRTARARRALRRGAGGDGSAPQRRGAGPRGGGRGARRCAARRASTPRPRSAETRPSSAPATSTIIVRCCTKRPTRAGSRDRTRCASLTSRGTSGGRGSRSPSATRRWRSPDTPCRAAARRARHRRGLVRGSGARSRDPAQSRPGPPSTPT